MSEYNKEDIKNLHYNNNNEIQYEYGGQVYHCSMEHLKEVLVTCWNLQQENQQLKEENEELKLIIGLRQKRNLIRKFDKEYDEEDKKKNPNRTYAGITPDAEVVYQRYYKQKEVIEEIEKYITENKKKVYHNSFIDDDCDIEICLNETEIRELENIIIKAKEVDYNG